MTIVITVEVPRNHPTCRLRRWWMKSHRTWNPATGRGGPTCYEITEDDLEPVRNFVCGA